MCQIPGLKTSGIIWNIFLDAFTRKLFFTSAGYSSWGLGLLDLGTIHS